MIVKYVLCAAMVTLLIMQVRALNAELIIALSAQIPLFVQFVLLDIHCTKTQMDINYAMVRFE